MSEPRAKRRQIDNVDVKRRDSFPDLSRLALSLQLGSYHAQTVYWGLINRSWWRNYEHAHSFFEVCFCFEGGGTFSSDGKVHDIRAGDIFIARPGQVHEIVSGKDLPMFIHFWAFTLVREKSALPTADLKLDTLVNEFVESERVVVRCNDALDPLLVGLCREVTQRQPGYQTVIRGMAEHLMLNVFRSVSSVSFDAEELPLVASAVGDPVINDTIRYIRYHLSGRLEIADIAAQMHLSERHLTRLFRSQTGKSLLEFITTERLTLARQLLVERKLSIKQVARAVGYPDAHYFTTLFGRKTGMTPSAFRESGGTRYVSDAPKSMTTGDRPRK